MDIWYYILTPFTWLLQLFYNITGSYGFALIFFAVVVKLILFPFSLKGKKSMIQMNMLSGKMQQIQKKYANDKERQNLEIQKLYEKEKVNPMGGCLWSFLPILVLFPLYAIIRQPLKYMMGLNGEQISAVADALNWATISIENGWVKNVAEGAANAFSNTGYNQLFLASLINPENLSAAQAAVGEGAAKMFAMNFQFLGLDLSQVPNAKFWVNGISWGSIGLFLIPVISAVTGLLFSIISMRTNQMNSQSQNAQQNSTNRMMMIMSPLMSLWIGFIMPAGLGVYWVVNNLLSLLQEFVAGKILKKDYEAAAAARAEQERLEKEEEKKRRREAAERKAQALAEAKTNKGKKKAAAVEKKKSDASVIEVSRVGIRSYARGRAYDPYRYSPDGPTLYKDPGAPIDENAVEAALEKKSDKLQEAALGAAADEMIAEELVEEKTPEAPDKNPVSESAVEENGTDSEDPWAKLDEEIEEIQKPEGRE
ncbi:YidC/Oxa1 family membrane protein insertase [Intestinimonas butyriciproducens]|uniref:YidC/Oxa1 family membrane protein insertase n=1 Tax=Intestinimonas butyriciproducens TaxID=1297617 RepID=UPI00267121B5|nr:YidC/Oxa1 family membrane protein insertase [Intestinimonas butyriciproducens]